MSLIIDDTLALDAGELTSSLSIAEQQQLKAILLTHQHYDHIRDIPMIAINLYNHGASINIYSTPEVRDTIETHLFNGEVYPKFQELPEAKPTVSFNLIVPYKSKSIDSYEILAIPVNHCDGTVGYQIRDNAGKVMFYTADTGPGLINGCQQLSPQLLIVDVTMPNNYEQFAVNSGHLTPNLLNKELTKFQELKGYLPQVTVVHMDPTLEPEIKEEIAVIARALKSPITLAHEGMQLHI
ncbi:MBL fold metallo-hydrolase [Chloroflexota bacterium]